MPRVPQTSWPLLLVPGNFALFSVIHFAISNTSCKWAHIVCSLVHLFLSLSMMFLTQYHFTVYFFNYFWNWILLHVLLNQLFGGDNTLTWVLKNDLEIPKWVLGERIQSGENYSLQKQISEKAWHNQEMVRSSGSRSLGGAYWDSWKRRLEWIGLDCEGP